MRKLSSFAAGASRYPIKYEIDARPSENISNFSYCSQREKRAFFAVPIAAAAIINIPSEILRIKERKRRKRAERVNHSLAGGEG